MKQTHLDKWPSGDGWPIGILSLSPDELSERCGLVFKDEIDELGPLREAIVETDSVGHVVLSSHPKAPSKGTDVEVDLSVGREEALAAVRNEFGIDVSVFSWVTPHERSPRWDRLRQAALDTEHAQLLTPRESEVLNQSLMGLSASEVAVQLGIAAKTVLTHLAHIRAKLGGLNTSRLESSLKGTGGFTAKPGFDLAIVQFGEDGKEIARWDLGTNLDAAAKKAIKPGDHFHRWRVSEPSGQTSIGTCKVCGATKEFKNWLSDGDFIAQNESGTAAPRREKSA